MAINKRIPLLALTILMAVLGAALVAAFTFGGGAKKTVASRSAAAFREAQRKSEPVAEGAHGHGALSPGAKAQPSHGEHGASETKKPDDMSPSKPSGDPHAVHATSAQAGTRSPAGREGQRQKAAGGHAGMQHGGGAAAGIPSDPMAGVPVVPPPAPKAAEASPGQPAGTLQPDPLDRPAETSVLDARRSAEMSQEMGGGQGMQGMQHGMTSYRQLDAGRDSTAPPQGEGSVAPGSPTSPDHRGMQHGSPPAAPPKAPAKRKLPPSKPTPGAPAPEPTHPPHHSGGSGATR